MEEKDFNTSSLKSVVADVVADGNEILSENTEALNPDTPLTINVDPDDMKIKEENTDTNEDQVMFAAPDFAEKPSRIKTVQNNDLNEDVIFAGDSFSSDKIKKSKRKQIKL